MVSNEVEDEAYFLDQEQSCLYDNKIWEFIECYLNLPKTPHLDQICWIMLTFVDCSSRMNNSFLYK